MTRIIFAVIALVLVVFGNTSGLATGESEHRPPNVVFVIADDLGYGDVGCFGQQQFATPHLDRLAENGMRLTHHYAGSSVCAPSRCALMTGLHTGHCEIRGNREAKPIGQQPLAKAAVTVAELLRDAGYVTGAFGKWGLGFPGSEGDPLRQGFDRFYGYNCQRNAHRYYPDFLYDDDRRVELDGKTYSPSLIMDRAEAFIRDHASAGRRDKPFFCFLPVTAPHAAMQAPEEERSPFRFRYPQFEDKVGSYAGTTVQNPIASFAAMVTRLDNDMGRLVALLDELGVAEETLIVFTSDNGPHTEGGHDPDFFRSAGPLRGYKRDLYEGGIRVPTIVCWPGHTPPQTTCDLPSAGWDWLPTLCDLAGAEPPVEIDGLSLLPSLTGKPGQQEHDHLYWEFHEQGGKQAVRRGDWKAVRLNVARDPNGPVELYNLATDPGETTDLAATRPEIAEQLAALMARARVPSPRFNFKPRAYRRLTEKGAKIGG